jgi:hypothetical protein
MRALFFFGAQRGCRTDGAPGGSCWPCSSNPKPLWESLGRLLQRHWLDSLPRLGSLPIAPPRNGNRGSATELCECDIRYSEACGDLADGRCPHQSIKILAPKIMPVVRDAVLCRHDRHAFGGRQQRIGEIPVWRRRLAQVSWRERQHATCRGRSVRRDAVWSGNRHSRPSSSDHDDSAHPLSGVTTARLEPARNRPCAADRESANLPARRV